MLNMTLGNGTGIWNVAGDSSLTNLTNNGTVNMADSNRTGQQVTAKTLSGTGTLVMDLDWLSNQGTKGVTANSDYLTVTDSATGTQALVSDPTVMNLDKMGLTTASMLPNSITATLYLPAPFSSAQRQ